MKEHLFILKCLQKASPFYLFINLIDIFVSYISFIITLFFYKFIVDYFLYGEPVIKVVIISFGVFGGVGGVSELLHYWVSEIYNNLQLKKITKFMNGLVYNKCKDIDIACYEDTDFYNKYVRGICDAPERVTYTASIICTFVSSFLKIISVIGLFSSLDFIFVFAALLFCIQSFFTMKAMNKVFYEGYLLDTPINRKAEYMNYVFKSPQFAKEVKFYQIHDLLLNKYLYAREELRLLKVKRVSELLKILLSSNLAGSILKAIINLYVIYMIWGGKFTVGDFTFVFASVMALSEAVSKVINVIPEVKNNKLMIGTLRQILEYSSQRQKNRGQAVVGKEEMRLYFENVSFAYPCQPERLILNNINVQIKEGEHIVIVGENGSGKSTFLKLLLGIYMQQTGEIRLNEQEYHMYDESAFKNLFGVVFQDYNIYCNTIAENILFKEKLEEKDEELIWEALEFSGLAEKVRSLKKGIHSVITKEFDENGIYLSGGEYQRLAIARAYVRNSRVIIFDEPTSALDPIAENDVMNKLSILGRGKTVICVSHRMSATIKADRILVFNQGTIAESGNHMELMKRKGLYYEMFMKQAEHYL